MNQTIDWINKIISELVEPTNKLKDILLKVQVLAFQIKNDKLKEWVDNELNGYLGEGKIVPDYRRIPTLVFGNLIQQGFAGATVRNDCQLPIEYLQADLRDELMSLAMNSSVSQLEHMMEKDSEYMVSIPHLIHTEISKILGNGWEVDSAWRKISPNSVEGILSSIKSKLLTFMLELVDELGENEKIDIMKDKKNIDKLFDKTIGQITGGTVNINLASDSVQAINLAEGANMNISKGDHNTLNISSEITAKLEGFIEDLKAQIKSLGLNEEGEQDIKNEITRIETQLNRPSPKWSIINEGLRIVYDILVEVTASAMAPNLIETTAWLIQSLKG